MFAEMELEGAPWSGLYCFVPTLSHYIHLKCTQVGTIPIIFTGRAHSTAPYDPSFCIQAHSHKFRSGPRPMELRERVWRYCLSLICYRVIGKYLLADIFIIYCFSHRQVMCLCVNRAKTTWAVPLLHLLASKLQKGYVITSCTSVWAAT